MIDVTKIKDLNELEEMKGDLNFFINKKIIADLYIERGFDKYELESDRADAREALTQVEAQIKRLNQPVKKRGSKRPRRGTPKKSSAEQ